MGVSAVDKLTIVAHDKFQEIVDEANRPDSALKVVPVYIGKDIATETRKAVTVAPAIETTLFGDVRPASSESSPDGETPGQSKLAFEDPAEREVAKAAYEAIKRFERLGSSAELKKPEIQAEIIKVVKESLPVSVQGVLAGIDSPPSFEKIVETVTEKFVEMTIDIPRIVVTPKGDQGWTFDHFNVDTSSLNLQPVSQDILLQSLQNNRLERLADQNGLQTELVPENYIVRHLIDFDDVSYDDHSELLYELSGQTISHLRSYLKDEREVTNVLQYHGKRISEVLHAQMANHQTLNETDYDVRVTKGFVTLRDSNYSIDASERARNFRSPVDNPQQIRSMHFGGFQKCLYSLQKFDSDSERRFSIILENDNSVIKWFKPSKNQFHIYYSQDEIYEPDFVVETDTAKYLCEVKRADDVDDVDVNAKKRAAEEWCENASAHELGVAGKPWTYHVIPHTMILSSSTFTGVKGA